MTSSRPVVSTHVQLIAAGICLLLAVGCSAESQDRSQDGRLHPHSDLIPTYDVETHPVTRDEATGEPGLPALLADVSEGGDDLESTGIFVRGASSVNADQLSEDRIVVLDTQHDLLMVYHPEAGRIDTVASNDGAPENVRSATGMDVYRDTVQVSTMDYRLQTFDCSAECSYAGTTTLDFSAKDVAAREGRVSLVGFTYDADEENHGMLSELVHRMDGEEVQYRFMDAYESTNPQVDSEMTDGFIAHAGGHDVFAFHHMPYLYVFEDGEAIAMFEIDAFSLMGRREGVDPYSISMPTAAVVSSISRVQNYSDDELFVVVETVDRGQRIEGPQDARNIDEDDISVSLDYYLLNVASMTAAYAGSITFGAEGGPHVIPTRDYAIVVEEGEVKYMPN